MDGDGDSNEITVQYKTNRRATLTLRMGGDSQSRSFAFENFHVVRKNTISMTAPDVGQKLLVDGLRGGDLLMGMESIVHSSTVLWRIWLGYDVIPLMYRVRWGNTKTG
jgi:arylamine N-acetyltransferase